MYPKSRTIHLYGDLSNLFNFGAHSQLTEGSMKWADVSNFDTSEVTRMDRVFESCTGLGWLHGLANWNTSKVTSMDRMFYGTRSINQPQVDAISDWDVSNVESMGGMFGNSRLSPSFSLNLSKWNVSKVSYMNSMFYGSNFTSLDLSGWNTSNVTNMSYMFTDCKYLSNISYGNSFVNTGIYHLDSPSNQLNNSWCMFYHCPANKPNWTNGAWNSDGTFIASS